jgi:ubiquinone/menaquinone biosynthesis C-methylase UbiE
MSNGNRDAVKKQFGASAEAYVASTTHAKGSDLALLPKVGGLTGREEVLDVATAVGHTALALAPHAHRVVGVDLTPAMLEVARRLAAERGVSNVLFLEGDAERLPFGDNSFDLVTCRIAAHHFPNVALFCREATRVLRPGGRLLVVDNVVPEEVELDRFMNSLDKLRDPSHYRAWRVSEWAEFYAQAGLSFRVAHQFMTVADREDWLARMNVPEETAEQIRRMLAGASAAAKEAYAITESGFSHHKAMMVGVKS